LVSLEHESGVSLGLIVRDFCSEFFVSSNSVVHATLFECVIVLPVSCALGSALTLFLEIGLASIDLGEVFNLLHSRLGFGICEVFGEELEAPLFLLDPCLIFRFQPGFLFEARCSVDLDLV
jgi:hypothetical protein